jgi:hypothetical protein
VLNCFPQAKAKSAKKEQEKQDLWASNNYQSLALQLEDADDDTEDEKMVCSQLRCHVLLFDRARVCAQSKSLGAMDLSYEVGDASKPFQFEVRGDSA